MKPLADTNDLIKEANRIVNRTKNLVDFSNLSLVLQVYGGVEVRYLLVRKLRDGVTLA